MSLIKRGQVLSQPPHYGRVGVPHDLPAPVAPEVFAATQALRHARNDRSNKKSAKACK